MSPDGKTFMTYTLEGIDVVRDGQRFPVKAAMYSTELVWDPTSRYVVYQVIAEGGEALMLIDTKEPIPTAKEIHRVASPSNLRGIEFSPWGDELYFMVGDTSQKKIHYLINRIDIKSKKVETVVDENEAIDFFMPPVTWFEHGQGSQKGRPYSIVYGTKLGLFVVPRDGALKDASKKRVLSQAPAVGLTNLEWSPDGDFIIMYYDQDISSPTGESLRGVTLAHVGKAAGKGKLEKLYEGNGIHTLWFSPKGKYVTWIKEAGCWYRDPKDEGKEGILIPNPVFKNDKGESVEVTDKKIKGASWNEDETRLAITAGNQVWIYNTTTKTTEIYYEFGKGLSHFVAEPRWRGEKLLLSVFENMRLSGREAPRRETEGPVMDEAEAREKIIEASQAALSKARAEFEAKRKAESDAEAERKRKALEKYQEEQEREAKKNGNKPDSKPDSKSD